MKLFFFMCSNFQGIADVAHLAEIVLKNNFVLTWEYGKTPNGRMGPNPYYGETYPFVENKYHNDKIISSTTIVDSTGPHFLFEAIAKFEHQIIDIPRSDYIAIMCSGFILGGSYNYVSVLMNFGAASTWPDESPYFEEGTQLMLKLGLDMYKYLRPWYGWLDYSQYDFLSREAIRDGKELDTLYWANFYGPQYVEKYGGKFFLESPCWKKEILSDGGVFLQLSERFTRPVSGENKRILQEYFSPNGISLSRGNPFDEDYQEQEY